MPPRPARCWTLSRTASKPSSRMSVAKRKIELSTRPARASSLVAEEDRVDLDLEARQVRLDGRPRRERLREEFRVDLVHCGEVGHVAQEDADAHGVRERAAGSFGHRSEVRERLAGLVVE